MGNHKKKPLQIFNQSSSRYSTKMMSMMTLVSSLSASPVNVESTKAASPYVNLGCQCSSLTFVDQYGTVQGNCRSADSTGALWCCGQRLLQHVSRQAVQCQVPKQPLVIRGMRHSPPSPALLPISSSTCSSPLSPGSSSCSCSSPVWSFHIWIWTQHWNPPALWSIHPQEIQQWK